MGVLTLEPLCETAYGGSIMSRFIGLFDQAQLMFEKLVFSGTPSAPGGEALRLLAFSRNRIYSRAFEMSKTGRLEFAQAKAERVERVA